MSTKIYTAWRFSYHLIPDFVAAMDSHQVGAALARLRLLVDYVKPEIVRKVYDDKGWASEMTFDQFLAEKGGMIRCRTVLRAAYAASVAKTRNPFFDLDSGFNLWIADGFAYAIPFGEEFTRDGFAVPFAADFAYWNNSDRPDEVTDDEWDARRDAWDRICLNDWNAGRLEHWSVCIKDHTRDYELATRLLGQDKAFGATIFIDEDDDAESLIAYPPAA